MSYVVERDMNNNKTDYIQFCCGGKIDKKDLKPRNIISTMFKRALETFFRMGLKR